jgi:hypothetical protein
MKSQVMDRGSSAVDYIMTGEEESIIEVDLNSPKSREGLTTIKRQITRSTVTRAFVSSVRTHRSVMGLSS